MTLWDFLSQNFWALLAGLFFIITLVLVIIFVAVKRGVSIENPKLGFKLTDAQKKRYFSVEALALENSRLRQIANRIHDLQGRLILQRQMQIIEEFIDRYYDISRSLFLEYISTKKVVGPMRDNAMHDNDRVLKEQRLSAQSMLRISMRQNGLALISDSEYENYCASKYKILVERLKQVRITISFDEVLVGTDYIEYAEALRVSAQSDFRIMLISCRKVAIEAEHEIACLQDAYRKIETHFAETGEVLDADSCIDKEQ